MALIGRIFVIFFAVMLASMAAGIAISIGLLGAEWNALSGDPAERLAFWGVALFASGATVAIAFLPLLIFIVAAESLRWRSFLLYVAAGAAMLTLAYYSSGFYTGYEESIDRAPPMIPHNLEIAAAAGAIFGLIYWLIAGRKAGRWRDRA